jgi:hypothetical protein
MRRNGGFRHAPDTIGAHRPRQERLSIQENPCYFGVLTHSLGIRESIVAGLVADVEEEGQIAWAMGSLDRSMGKEIG